MDEYATPTCLMQQINRGSGRTFQTHVNGSRTVQILPATSWGNLACTVESQPVH